MKKLNLFEFYSWGCKNYNENTQAFSIKFFKFMTNAYIALSYRKNLFIGGLFFLAFIISLIVSWNENVNRYSEWKEKFDIRNNQNKILITDMIKSQNPEIINKVINLNQISRNDTESICIESFNGKSSIEFEMLTTFVSSIKVLFLSEIDITCYKQINKTFIYISYIFVLFSYVLAIFLTFFEIIRKNIRRNKHSVVIGLNAYSSELIKNLCKNNIVKVYEEDKFNIYIDEAKLHGAIVISNSFSDVVSKNSDIYKASEIFIIDENDGKTLNYLSLLIDEETKNEKSFIYNPNIYVEIEDRDNRLFFENNGIFKLSSEDQDFNLVLISLDEIITHKIFEKKCLVENMNNKFNQDYELNILIIGFNNLVEEIIYHILKIGHFAGEKPVNITVLDKDYKYLNCKFSDWKTIGLNPYRKETSEEILWKIDFLDKNTLFNNDFYFHEENKKFNFDRIIIADKDTNTSVNVLSYLNKKFYSILHKQRVIIQLYNTHNKLNKTIDKNKFNFDSYFTFGAVEDICKPELIRNSKMSKISEITNNYKEKGKIDKQWNNLDTFTRESNVTEKLHMNIKLHHLGFKLELDNSIPDFTDYEQMVEKYKEKISNLPKENIIKSILNLPKITDLITIKIENPKNQEIEDKKLSELDSKDLIKNFEEAYNQNDLVCLSCIELSKKIYNLEDKKFLARIDKLAKVEHTRWNAMHLLNGWKRKNSKGKDLIKKEHFDICDWDTLTKEDPSVLKYDYKNIYQIPFVAFTLGFKIKKIKNEA